MQAAGLPDDASWTGDRGTFCWRSTALMENRIICRVFAGAEMPVLPESFQVGEHIHLWGRIQSRTYQKKLDADTVEKRTAYEISVSKIECAQS